ncbi:hypothetical protein [Silvibacterium acidisoli]|uniref:hypothetical protein n=1 Tax=Acidobacteriaceae bacterium ZG23-2 TaxID=2883246 RepID=UPI00406C44CF
MTRCLRFSLLLLPLVLAGCSHPKPVYYPPPPPAYSQIAAQGYHDGFQAARRDASAGLPPDPARHPRFRRPPVPPPAFEDYRQGFRHGYDAFLHGGPRPGM